jgi:hypothetical protein
VWIISRVQKQGRKSSALFPLASQAAIARMGRIFFPLLKSMYSMAFLRMPGVETKLAQMSLSMFSTTIFLSWR